MGPWHGACSMSGEEKAGISLAVDEERAGGGLSDHPLRYQLANELHARPFPSLTAPCHAVFLAIKAGKDAASRNLAADRAHLIALLDRFGAPHPPPDATHYFGDIGRHKLKWEQHTEFVTYTLFGEGVAGRPFDPAMFDVFPADWLAQAPGLRLTSALIRVEEMPTGNVDDAKVQQQLYHRFRKWFVPESLAASFVAERSAVIAGDYRIDGAGHLRFAVFTRKGISQRRIGRIVQRLCEVETYKTMALLALPKARTLAKQLAVQDAQVAELVRHIKGTKRPESEVLDELLGISTELENLVAQSSFRFSATKAYAAIVEQRIAVMREERFADRQTFSEFMLRRFDPAMRTVKAVARQLDALAERTKRAGDLLRTRVEVERSAQNQQLLASMDRRADLQLRLQKTVEGLSVVAISYYAVNLLTYALYPLAKQAGVDKPHLSAFATPVVVFLVWLLVRKIRKAH